MSVLLQVHNGEKGFGGKLLFDQASFAVNQGEHIGVIGPNGAGKSTLFKILAGIDELGGGKLITANNLRLSYLAQEDDFAPDLLVEEYLEQESILPIWELKSLGKGLGLSEQHFSSPIQTLSGGYRMRCKLLCMIGQEPNLLLLDEPTNYLDLESLITLEKFLLDFKGAFLLISHDREFLRQTTDHILEIEAGSFTKFNGNIDDYFEQKQMLREQLQKQALSQEAKRSEILAFAARFGAKATKAKQAQSRLKRLGKMQSIEVNPLPITAKIRIPEPTHTGKQAILGHDVCLGYPEKVVLDHVELNFQRGDHVGVVGINGAGKSTLLKALAGRLPPLSGKIDWGYQVDVAYYAQHVAEELKPEYSVYDSLMDKAHPGITPQEVKDLAGSLLFSDSDIDKKTRVLSGGEKARVSLGQVLLKRSPCLLLDEPTNHLDFHTVEALTQALMNYSGTLITVSHDRSFIRRVATKILEIQNGKAEIYPGNYDEYVWSVQKGSFSNRKAEPTPAEAETKTNKPADDTPSANKSPKTNNGQQNFLTRDKRKRIERQIRQKNGECAKLEKLVQEAQQVLSEINQQLIHCSGPEASELTKNLTNQQNKLDEFESRWLSLVEEASELEEQLGS